MSKSSTQNTTPLSKKALIKKTLKDFRKEFNSKEFNDNYTLLFESRIKAEINGEIKETDAPIQELLNYHAYIYNFIKEISALK